MNKSKLCKWCGNYPAVVPIKRYGIGRFKREICANCHSDRLREDLKILNEVLRRNEQVRQSSKGMGIVTR